MARIVEKAEFAAAGLPHQKYHNRDIMALAHRAHTHDFSVFSSSSCSSPSKMSAATGKTCGPTVGLATRFATSQPERLQHPIRRVRRCRLGRQIRADNDVGE